MSNRWCGGEAGMPKPLDGVKVLDMTRVLAGPYCTMMLGDMGADVVKIERPEAGDDTRGYGPPFVNGESAYFMSINRSKRSLTLNLKHPEALHILRRLIETADLPGYDLIIQGEGGVASLTGDPNGPPYKVGNSQADVVAGMMAFQGILLALLARAQTSQGQKIDLSMLDCQVAMLTYQAGIYFATGQSPTRMGNQHPTITPYETYRCQDGYINLACGNDGMWRAFCKAAGHDAWANDERFRTNAERVQNRRALSSLMEPVMLEKTTQEWIELLLAAGIACGKIQSVGEVCEDPQIIARDT